ncbi:MAG: hypothetical protein R3E68_03010 [Burkholderiaceae bacterium]
MSDLIFGIMSAGYSDKVVRQLAQSLHPAPVVIHHDFSRYPQFRLDMPNAWIVPNAVRTGWGNWDFVQGILRLIEHTLENFEFDHFQLLSPTCLPIQPLSAFRHHLAENPADAHLDLVSLDDDPQALLEFAYRAFLPDNSLRQRLLLRSRLLALGHRPRRVNRSGLCISQPSTDDRSSRWRFEAGLALARAARHGWFGATPFNRRFLPYMSSVWFCARRPVCEHILRTARSPDRVEHFRRGRMIDEVFFASIIGNSGADVGPMNHLINDFDEEGHPRFLTINDLHRLAGSSRFFARKFPDDLDDPVRQQALAWSGLAPQVDAAGPKPAPEAVPYSQSVAQDE